MRLKSIGWVVLDPKTRKPMNKKLFATHKGALEEAIERKWPQGPAEVFIKQGDVNES